jgi:hypothetical protein
MLKVLRQLLGHRPDPLIIPTVHLPASPEIDQLEQELLQAMQNRSTMDDNIRQMREFADRLNKFYAVSTRRTK